MSLEDEASEEEPEQLYKTVGLDEATKMLGLFAILAYLAGVVTVATYAESLDVSTPSLDLFKTRYILTGVVVMLSLLVPGVASYTLCHLLRQAYREKGRGRTRHLRGPKWVRVVDDTIAGVFLSRKRTWATIVGLLLVLGGYLYLMHVVVTWSDGEVDWSPATNWLFLILTGISGLGGVLGYLTWAYSQSLKKQTDERVDSHWRRAASGMACCLCALIFAIAFSHWVYPHLPEQFGGGKPKHALLTFTEEGATMAEALGLTLQLNGRTSQPVEILYQDDTQYTVRFDVNEQKETDGKRTAQLDKKMVAGFSSESERPWATGLFVSTDDEARLPNEKWDEIVFAYSELMKRKTLWRNWKRNEWMKVALVAERIPDTDANLVLTVENAVGKRIRLGSVVVNGEDLQEAEAAAVMHQVGESFVVRLTEPFPVADDPESDIDEVEWAPSDLATDIYGNDCNPRITTPVQLVEREDVPKPEVPDMSVSKGQAQASQAKEKA